MTCRICSNSRGNVGYRVREMNLGLREWFEYFQCAQCGCLQIRDFPPEMGKYYPSRYYSFAPPSRVEPPRTRRVRELARTTRDRYAITGRGMVGRILYAGWSNPGLRQSAGARFPGEGAKELGLGRRSRILDVGCGSGQFLLELQAAGFNRLLGIDAFLDDDLAYPGGVRVLKRTIHEVSGQWDVIMFHHSFEHIPDPQATLSAAAKLLAPDGACLVRLPLVSSAAWERYGVNWVQLDAPRHFFLHSIESLRRVAGSARMEIAKIVHDSGSLQFFGSELYLRDIPLQPVVPSEVAARAAAFTPSELEVFERQAQTLNAEGRGDQAAFYLKRAR